MPLILRNDIGQALTWTQLDGNFTYLQGQIVASSSIHGTPSQVVYFDNSGNSTSDSLFVRIPGDGTLIADSFVTDEFTGLNISQNKLSSQLIYNNVTTNENAHVTVGGSPISLNIGYENGTQSSYLNMDVNGVEISSTPAKYVQTTNFLGLGLTGAGQIFGTGSNGVNIIASIDQSPFGGSKNFTLVGFVNPSGNNNSNIQLHYDELNDNSTIEISTIDSNSDQASIILHTSTSSNGVTFLFSGGVNYKFPTTDPSTGQVLGYESPNTLGWVTSGGGGGGTGSFGITFSVQLADGSGGFTSVEGFYYDKLTDVFKVFTPGLAGGGFSSDGGSGGQQLGDINGIGNKTILTINDNSQTVYIHLNDEFKVSNGSNKFLSIDIPNNIYQLGDINNTEFNTKVVVDDSAQIITLNSIKKVQMGDINNINNGTEILINDEVSTVNVISNIFNISKATPGSFNIFSAEPLNHQVIIGDVDGIGNGTKLVVDDLTQSININSIGKVIIGDVNTVGNGTSINITDSGNKITANAQVIDINSTTGNTNIGDINTVGNGTNIKLDDFNNIIYIDSKAGSSTIGDAGGNANATRAIVNDSIQTFVYGKQGSGNVLSLDINNKYYKIGDFDAFGNKTTIEVADFKEEIILSIGTASGAFRVTQPGVVNRLIEATMTDHTIEMGDLDSIGNNSVLRVNDSLKSVRFQVGTHSYFVANSNIKKYGIGDLSNSNNSQYIIVDDNGSRTDINSIGKVIIGDVNSIGNETSFHIDDSANKITALAGHINFNLNEYANNTAAVAGGLTASDFYFTNVAGDGIVKIVI